MRRVLFLRWVRRRLGRLLRSRPLRLLTTAPARRYRGVASVLLYHRVVAGAEAGEAWGNRSLAVDPDAFDAQMRRLASGFRCLSVPECVKRLRDGSLPERSIVVTLDDGYRDNLEVALPVLERHGVPAAIFVTTGLVDGTSALWWDELERALAALDRLELAVEGRRRRWRLGSEWERFLAFRELGEMGRTWAPDRFAPILEQIRRAAAIEPAVERMLSWDQLAELARHPLVTIGAHTVTHPPLASLSPEAALAELVDSRRRLEEILDVPVTHLAFPYGGPEQVGRREARLAAEAGYESAFTTREGHLFPEHARHLRLLPRLGIFWDDDLRDVDWRLSGLHAAVRNRLRRVVTA